MALVLVKDDHRDAKSYIILSWIGIAGRQGLFSHKEELSEFSSEVVKSPSLKIFNQGPTDYCKQMAEGVENEQDSVQA